MTEPIVFISRNRILPGKRAEFAAAYAQGVGMIGSSKPRTALFAAYVDETGTDVRIVHAFPDAAAMALHFEGSDERTTSFDRALHAGRLRDLRPGARGSHRSAATGSGEERRRSRRLSRSDRRLSSRTSLSCDRRA
jgi:hypothetical protein